MHFTIAIIGRPNVGKSTLFNRLVGKKLALVDDRPGVTRDRREGDAQLGDLEFSIVDTAGLEQSDPGSLTGRMRAQTEAAIEGADAIFFVIDARTGLTPTDRHFGDLVRRSGKPIILIANKAEGKIGTAGAYEAFDLGLGEPIALSPNMATGRRLAVVWGVHCVVTEDARDQDDMVERACRIAFKEGFARSGQRVIVVAGVPLGTPGATNMLRIAYVGAESATD